MPSDFGDRPHSGNLTTNFMTKARADNVVKKSGRRTMTVTNTTKPQSQNSNIQVLPGCKPTVVLLLK